MRIVALATLAITAVSAAGPASARALVQVLAQAYAPDYPVCLKVYSIGGSYTECDYTSLAQCAASASGRAAQCMPNPYVAKAYAAPSPRPHHNRRHRIE